MMSFSRLAASVERSSEHPVGQAILSTAQEKGLPISEAHEFRSVTGRGVRAKVGERSCGGRKPVSAGGRGCLRQRSA